MSEESLDYLYSLVCERIDDLYCQVEDGVEGSKEELKMAEEARNELTTS